MESDAEPKSADMPVFRSREEEENKTIFPNIALRLESPNNLKEEEHKSKNT